LHPDDERPAIADVQPQLGTTVPEENIVESGSEGEIISGASLQFDAEPEISSRPITTPARHRKSIENTVPDRFDAATEVALVDEFHASLSKPLQQQEPAVEAVINTPNEESGAQDIKVVLDFRMLEHGRSKVLEMNESAATFEEGGVRQRHLGFLQSEALAQLWGLVGVDLPDGNSAVIATYYAETALANGGSTLSPVPAGLLLANQRFTIMYNNANTYGTDVSYDGNNVRVTHNGGEGMTLIAGALDSDHREYVPWALDTATIREFLRREGNTQPSAQAA
jgi:hypothetical protein